ncbi:MAG: DUF664 domain-containing protein [Cytophagaceae bacterium]|nr:DUF664 domain-containing protein [Cytophagaceae bacterium]MBL0301551.1 DUF664 domain-containing protein [Cytophagaceae bacterium]MBL0324374.1 DUF664 domain-containing protein [Cytophagaceae bacterium]
MEKNIDRRKFTQNLGIGLGTFMLPLTGISQPVMILDENNLNHIGPRSGFTPQIGTLISMLDWLSNSVIQYNRKLSVEQLDFLFDKESNTIGSLMMHLAATEVIYQDLTFHNLEEFTPENKKKWNIAMELGDDARKEIKGNPLSYYKDMFDEVRATTKAEMKKRDDKWLLSGETKEWDWNNYCKWFHVAEHYANHRGQMTWYAKRLPK